MENSIANMTYLRAPTLMDSVSGNAAVSRIASMTNRHGRTSKDIVVGTIQMAKHIVATTDPRIYALRVLALGTDMVKYTVTLIDQPSLVSGTHASGT